MTRFSELYGRGRAVVRDQTPNDSRYTSPEPTPRSLSAPGAPPRLERVPENQDNLPRLNLSERFAAVASTSTQN